MPEVHARLSASGSHIWLNCPPAVVLSEGIENKDTPYTLEGTTAHKLAELMLGKEFSIISDKEFKKELKKVKASEFYCEEMEQFIKTYTDWIVEVYNGIHSEDKELLTEQRLDFSEWVPDGFGTGDVCIIADGTLYVIDLKYGKGVPVNAVGNPQLMLYGLGAYDAFSLSNDIDKLKLIINQPRLDSISEYEISVEDLLKWGDEVVRPAAALAAEGGGEQKTGDHCRFCKVKHLCRQRALEAMSVDPDRDKRLLSEKEIVEILDKVDLIKSFAEDVKSYAQSMAEEGFRWPGYKLVEGRSIRKFTDTAEVEKRLLDAGFDKVVLYKDPELLGISAMEKVVGGKKKLETICEGLIVKPPGAPTLVPMADKRPEIEMNPYDDGYEEE